MTWVTERCDSGYGGPLHRGGVLHHALRAGLFLLD
jgi:hypothetical protein